MTSAHAEIARLVGEARNPELPLAQQHAAFAELIRRFEEAALTWALRRLDDPEDARDAAQEAWLQAWLRLRRLREPASFGVWLQRLIGTACRKRRRSASPLLPLDGLEPGQDHQDTRGHQRLLARAMATLPAGDQRVVLLFYFLGRTIDEIAALLGTPRGTVGKRLHAARNAIRRRLPREARREFVRLEPSPQFQRCVRAGLFDEYVGTYRFDRRPDLVVTIARQGELLIGEGGGQRSVLATIGEDRLIPAAFDAMGKFQRDRRGRISGFVYYEFGSRLGLARKQTARD